jgi:hypothetical protein
MTPLIRSALLVHMSTIAYQFKTKSLILFFALLYDRKVSHLMIFGHFGFFKFASRNAERMFVFWPSVRTEQYSASRNTNRPLFAQLYLRDHWRRC